MTSSRPSLHSPSSPSPLSLLADPPTRLIDGAAMDYLLIEAVTVLRASSAVAIARAKKIEQEMTAAGLLPPPPPPPPTKSQPPHRDSIGSTTSRTQPTPANDDDDDDEAVRTRLEAIGLHVGGNFVERPLFSDPLDAIKFICKELWVACWDKQVDNLRTNHRGVFVLQDNAFKPISRISSWQGRTESLKRARLSVSLAAGLIRGALARIGLFGVVTTEITSSPHCTFQIKLPKNS